MNIITKLKEPFPAKTISFRVGATTKDKDKGIALAYLDARSVMNRFDEVCGTKWQNRYPEKGVCEIGLYIDSEWVWRANGAGETDIEGEKGQLSDSFKRAAVMWGIGRYLYYLPNEWVAIVPFGRSYKLKDTPTLPKWALPGYVQRMDQEIKAEAVGQILKAIETYDEPGLREIIREFDIDEQAYINREFNSAQRGTIHKMLGGS